MTEEDFEKLEAAIENVDIASKAKIRLLEKRVEALTALCEYAIACLGAGELMGSCAYVERKLAEIMDDKPTRDMEEV